MHPLRSRAALLFCALFLFAIRAHAQLPEVLIVGDSWAQLQWLEGTHSDVFSAHGFADVVVRGNQTAISGSTAEDWNTVDRLQVISDEIQDHPGIGVVQLTLGGNDFLNAWRADMTAAEVLSLQQQISADLNSVISHILQQGPEIEVILSFYDYPNFDDTLTDLLAFVCVPLWEQMAQPTPRELNEAARDFEATWALQADSMSRVYYVAHSGLMQNAYGFPEMGIQPGDIVPPGNLDLPSPLESMRFQSDCFHLRPAGYEILVENLFANYFSDKFNGTSGDYLLANNRMGLWSDRGRIGTGIDLRVVDSQAAAKSSNLNYFLTFFSFAQDNTQEWFSSTGKITGNDYNSDAVLRVFYDFDAGNFDSELTATVGNINIQFNANSEHPACMDGVDRSDAVELAVLNWTIDGESGSWCIEPLLNAALEGTNFDGLWFAGLGDNAWGFTLEVEGSNAVITLYYYDANGNPRWSQGVVTFDPARMEVTMYDFVGYCRLCEPTDVVATAKIAGTLTLELGTPSQSLDGGNAVSLNVSYQGAEGGSWERSDLPVQLISTPGD